MITVQDIDMNDGHYPLSGLNPNSLYLLKFESVSVAGVSLGNTSIVVKTRRDSPFSIAVILVFVTAGVILFVIAVVGVYSTYRFVFILLVRSLEN